MLQIPYRACPFFPISRFQVTCRPARYCPWNPDSPGPSALPGAVLQVHLRRRVPCRLPWQSLMSDPCRRPWATPLGWAQGHAGRWIVKRALTGAQRAADPRLQQARIKAGRSNMAFWSRICGPRSTTDACRATGWLRGSSARRRSLSVPEASLEKPSAGGDLRALHPRQSFARAYRDGPIRHPARWHRVPEAIPGTLRGQYERALPTGCECRNGRLRPSPASWTRQGGMDRIARNGSVALQPGENRNHGTLGLTPLAPIR